MLGCGFAGRAVALAARARGLEVLATVRSEARALALRAEGLEVLAAPTLPLDGSLAARVRPSTHVVVAFPPDGLTDAALAPQLAAAGAITYVSSVGVYGAWRGTVDDTTPLPDAPTERGQRVLAAEDAWRRAGATTLRCPGIYGPDRGLHVRIARGLHRIPGDGTRALSRVHVDDLAALVLASARVRQETFVVGDLCPTTHGEIAAWLCAEHHLPMPPHAPLEEVHETLRADRRIDPTRALRVLGITLRYPSYREGMRANPR